MIYALLVVMLLLCPIRTHAYTTDKYGGINQINCPSGTAAHFYTQKIGHRWMLCTPAGHGFFMLGLYNINHNWSGLTGPQLITKYGSHANPYVVGGLTDAQRYPYNFAINKAQQLLSWGFNFTDSSPDILPTTVDSNWTNATHTIPDQFRVPFSFGGNTSRYAVFPSGGPGGCNTSYPLKDIMVGVGQGFNGGTRYGTGDYWDPHFPTCANLLTAAIIGSVPAAPNYDFMVYYTIDEGDQTGGLLGALDQSVSGFPGVTPDNGVPNDGGGRMSNTGWVTLATAPMQTSGSGLGPPIQSYATDPIVHAKLELANELVTEYLCTAVSTPLACCTGNKTGTCSVDPGAGVGTAVTGANMTTATNALNAAWASYYTTLGSSDANCSSSLATCLTTPTYAAWGDNTQTFTCAGASCSGTLSPNPIVEWPASSGNGWPRWTSSDGVVYARTNGSGTVTNGGGNSVVTGGSVTDANGNFTLNFGSSIASHSVTATFRTQANSTGTGLIDEDGSCPAKGAHPCWMGSAQNLSGETTAMQNDLNAFLYNYASNYFITMKAAVNAVAPGLMIQMSTGGYSEPPWPAVIEAERDHLDLPQFFGIPGYCPTCTDMQQRLDFIATYLGDKPFFGYQLFYSNTDGAINLGLCGTQSQVSTTQAGRGAVYAQLPPLTYNATTTAYNSHPVVGFDYWAMYDGGCQAWGMLTASDNAYDGIEAVIATGTNSWGYSDGGEAANYGDSITSTTTANQAALTALANEMEIPGGVHFGPGFW